MEFTGIWGSIITPRHVVWVARTPSWPKTSRLWICWFNKFNLEKSGIWRVVDAGGLANARKDRRTWKDSNFALMVLPNHQEAKDHCLYKCSTTSSTVPQNVPVNLLLSQSWVMLLCFISCLQTGLVRCFTLKTLRIWFLPLSNHQLAPICLAKQKPLRTKPRPFKSL